MVVGSSRHGAGVWRLVVVVSAALSVVARSLSGWCCAVLVGVVHLGGCASPAQGPLHPSLPAQCTHTITRAEDVSMVLALVAPGDTVCFVGPDLAQAVVTMARSGTARAPIRLVAQELVTVREVQIRADYVSVEGFDVAGGAGVSLEGTGLTVKNNTVHDTQQDGISCHPCMDSTIESNVLRHNTTNGVDLTGERITVRANTISGTVPQDNGDTDGMRFYGNDLQITDNTIVDLSMAGYASPPHPDCFQTLDAGKPPTFNVLIANNICRNVDAQCLIATGDQDANSGAPPAVPSIIFRENSCANNGAQAVDLRRWPNVQIVHNTFSGSNLRRAVLITEGSTGTTVTGNTTTGDCPTVEIDDSSRPGSHINDRVIDNSRTARR